MSDYRLPEPLYSFPSVQHGVLAPRDKESCPHERKTWTKNGWVCRMCGKVTND